MRKLALVFATLALLLPLGATGPVRAGCAPDDDLCNQLAAAQQQQQQTQGELARIQQQIKDTQKQMVALWTYIQQLTAQINQEQAQIDQTSKQIAKTEADIRGTQASITRAQAHIAVRQAIFDGRVRSIDKHGKVDYMALILSSTSFSQMVDRLLGAEQVVQADRQMLDDLQNQRHQLDALQAQLQSQRDQESALLAQQQAAKAHLQQVQQQQQAAYAYQAQLELQYKAQADQLAQQEQQISDEIAALQAALDARAKGGGGGTGKFAFPERSNYYISQGFGCSPYVFEMYWPSCPTKHFHSGIDIAGVPLNPVYAADNGVVQEYSTSYGYGNYIIIIHGNGWATLYGHLDHFVPGINNQLVIRGQQIAYEGTTGNSTGYHLHFEVRYNGNYMDPCNYVSC